MGQPLGLKEDLALPDTGWRIKGANGAGAFDARENRAPRFACLPRGLPHEFGMSSGPEDRDDAAGLRARLDRLSAELKRRAPRPAAPAPKPQPKADGAGSAMSLGLRAGSEFVSAVIVGSGIGWA